MSAIQQPSIYNTCNNQIEYDLQVEKICAGINMVQSKQHVTKLNPTHELVLLNNVSCMADNLLFSFSNHSWAELLGLMPALWCHHMHCFFYCGAISQQFAVFLYRNHTICTPYFSFYPISWKCTEEFCWPNCASSPLFFSCRIYIWGEEITRCAPLFHFILLLSWKCREALCLAKLCQQPFLLQPQNQLIWGEPVVHENRVIWYCWLTFGQMQRYISTGSSPVFLIFFTLVDVN